MKQISLGGVLAVLTLHIVGVEVDDEGLVYIRCQCGWETPLRSQPATREQMLEAYGRLHQSAAAHQTKMIDQEGRGSR